MSEFQELIKSFGKSRDYVRDFFVYGFKSRQDFTSSKKSARTYDDERRRITSWLGEYVEEDTTESKGSRVKNISLVIDSNLLDENPLFAVWKTKSFTDNDVTLYFCIFDILCSAETAFTANDIADTLSLDYSLAVDTQMVRRKLNEYVKEGLLKTEKQGKVVLYRRGETFDELISSCSEESDELRESMKEAVSFMQLALPFGYVGSIILDSIDDRNEYFRVKHSFPAFTLEEEILFQILEAIKGERGLEIEVQSNRNENIQKITGIPLKILVSVRTGRRYVSLYQTVRIKKGKERRSRFVSIRLDQIKKVTVLESDVSEINDLKHNLQNNMDYVWGVSFTGAKTRVRLTLHIDKRYEGFILQRLEREGKNGTITRLGENTFCYEKQVFDPVEMYPWLRTFIGRIIDIRFINLDNEMKEASENGKLRNDFMRDILELEKMYR